MKCIHCAKDSNYKTRNSGNGKCGSCSRRFAFEPKSDRPKVTDMQFKRAIEDASAKGRLFFTERQLWYALNARLGSGATSIVTPIVFLIVFAVIGAGALFVSGGDFEVLPLVGIALIGAICFAIAILVRLARRRGPPRLTLDLQPFRDSYLRRWVAAHDPVERLLDPPADPRFRTTFGKGAARPEPDLTAYSFDRALVTDTAAIAAVLVANNFHFENNCAILSLDGYPHAIADTVRAMLRRNPRLTVFAVHDASPRGCALPLELRQNGWFPDPSITIVDLGLRPRQAWALRLFQLTAQATRLPTDLKARIGSDEIAWLESGRLCELAAVRPVRLMRAIFQGFAAARQANQGAAPGQGGQQAAAGAAGGAAGSSSSSSSSSGSGGAEFSSDTWADDAGADNAASDSFG